MNFFYEKKRTCFSNWAKITVKEAPQPGAQHFTNPQDKYILLEHQFSLKIGSGRCAEEMIFTLYKHEYFV